MPRRKGRAAPASTLERSLIAPHTLELLTFMDVHTTTDEQHRSPDSSTSSSLKQAEQAEKTKSLKTSRVSKASKTSQASQELQTEVSGEQTPKRSRKRKTTASHNIRARDEMSSGSTLTHPATREHPQEGILATQEPTGFWGAARNWQLYGLEGVSWLNDNVPRYTVSEICEGISLTLSERFAYVRIVGEVGQARPARNGHLYFQLRDEGATITCVCWAGRLPTLGVVVEEGLQLVVEGRLVTSKKQSSYLLDVQRVHLAGLGALLQQIQRLRERLAVEGLFDAERKRALPFLPRVIGIVTSPTGAVIHDMWTRMVNRFPVRFVLWPVAVQGPEAIGAVVAALEGFQTLANARDAHQHHNQHHAHHTTNATDAGDAEGAEDAELKDDSWTRWKEYAPDVIVIARGGGSAEDLLPFSMEPLLRAVAASRIPVVSAIGHDVDRPLLDEVADLRAPTPTAAIEMILPLRQLLANQINRLTIASQDMLQRLILQRTQALTRSSQRSHRRIARLVPMARARVEGLEQRWRLTTRSLTARLIARLEAAERKQRLSLTRWDARYRAAARKGTPAYGQILLQRRSHHLHRLEQRWQGLLVRHIRQTHTRLAVMPVLDEQKLLAQRHQRAARTLNMLDDRRRSVITDNTRKLHQATELLEARGYQSTLQRGYAMVLDAGGQVVRSIQHATVGSEVSIRLSDGVVAARITSVRPLPPTDL